MKHERSIEELENNFKNSLKMSREKFLKLSHHKSIFSSVEREKKV